jgi:hypothetical protein
VQIDPPNGSRPVSGKTSTNQTLSQWDNGTTKNPRKTSIYQTLRPNKVVAHDKTISVCRNESAPNYPSREQNPSRKTQPDQEVNSGLASSKPPTAEHLGAVSKTYADGMPTARHSTTAQGNLSKAIMPRWMLPWKQRQSPDNVSGLPLHRISGCSDGTRDPIEHHITTGRPRMRTLIASSLDQTIANGVAHEIGERG